VKPTAFPMEEFAPLAMLSDFSRYPVARVVME